MIPKPFLLFAVILTVLFAVGAASGALGEGPGGGTKVESELVQKTCPVMVGNPINKEHFVEYQGKKVYFCCPGCEGKFKEAPEKYLAKLPQFKQ